MNHSIPLEIGRGHFWPEPGFATCLYNNGLPPAVCSYVPSAISNGIHCRDCITRPSLLHLTGYARPKNPRGHENGNEGP